MFKSAIRRSEKKIKAVFKMQFQATQVPQLKAKKLTISLVPADVGKPTVRLGKSPIREGTCSWESPVYETVKLVKETKRGNFRQKIYYFIVSAGSSKAGSLGEGAIDFVDFLEAANPVMVSLPIEGTNSGAILHVTIQKLEQTLDERYIDEYESQTPKYHNGRGRLEMHLQDSQDLQNTNLEFTDSEQPNRIISHIPEQNGSLEDTQLVDATAYQVYLSLDTNPPGHAYQRYSDGLLKDSSDESGINTVSSLHEKHVRDRIEEASDDVGRLNTRIKMLERRGEVSELELQSLRRQMAKESRKVQELSEQIATLKKERDILKTEREQLKSSLKGTNKGEISNNSDIETKNVLELSEQIKQELHREKHISKNLLFQLQRTEDSNSELILSVTDLKEALNRKDKEIVHLSGQIKANRNEGTLEIEETDEKPNKADEVECLKQEKENLKRCIEHLTLDLKNLKKEKADVHSDLEKKQSAMLEMQHECLLSQRTVKQLKQETTKQALLYSECLTTIDELKTKVQSLEEELEKEAKFFQDNLTAAGRAMHEQEQRAIRAEEALRKGNWINTKEAEHLREELRRKSEEVINKMDENEKLRRKSEEVITKMDENEKLSMQTIAEGNQLRMQNKLLEKLLQKANDDIQLSRNEYERKLLDVSKEINLGAQSKKMVSLKVAGATENDVTANKKKDGRLKHEKPAESLEAHDMRTMINDKGQMKREYGDSKILQKWTEKNEELESELRLVKMEGEKLLEENNSLRNLIDEKNKRDEILHPKTEKLAIQYDKLRCSSQEMNLDNRDMKKQAPRLQSNPNKKQEARAAKDVLAYDKMPEEDKHKAVDTHSSDMLYGNTSEVAKLQRDEINSQGKLNKLSNEVTSMKEQNTRMAFELKEMHERYSEISLKFAEVEGERQQLVMTLRNLKNGKKM